MGSLPLASRQHNKLLMRVDLANSLAILERSSETMAFAKTEVKSLIYIIDTVTVRVLEIE